MMQEQKKINAAVIGASGYSGEELIRLLLRHPRVSISCVTSRQYAGELVSKVFPRFTGLDLRFSSPLMESIAAAAEVVFLALPHGLAAEFAVPLYEKGLRVLDVSADFRLRDPHVYRQYYKNDHPAPELLKDAVYGLPELYREQLREARLVACPGCYPTSVLLPACPLLKAGAVMTEDITICSMSGVSGAGRKVELPYIFPECNESLRAYAITGHRHLPEIEQELSAAGGDRRKMGINFIPHLVPVTRGIHSTIILKPVKSMTAETLVALWSQVYADEPFVRVLPVDALADTKNVIWTNCIEIGGTVDPRNGRIVVSSAIDNLTKGASGQAVQCMNIMLGLEESLGLL